MTSERGSISVLSIGFLVVLGLLVVVVINASAAFLAHQRLAATADGAAVAGADGIDRGAFYASGAVTLDQRSAESIARAYVAANQPDATITTQVVDGRLHVRLVTAVQLPLAPPGWFDQTSVAAEATSRLLPIPR